MNLGLTVIRVIVGALFAGHGAQKLFGWFGGHGLEGTGAFFESLGMRPGRTQALAAGSAELGGGVLLALGLVTPFAALLITSVMLVAIWTVHRPHGVWVSDGGYQLNLVYVAVALGVAAIGSGGWSLDRALGLHDAGVAWALGALALAIIGAAGAIFTGRRSSSASGAGAAPTAA